MKILLLILLIPSIWGYSVTPPVIQFDAYRGSEFNITVQLKTNGGSPVSNATVYLFHETHDILLGATTTNSTGYAHFIWFIPLSHELGLILLNVTFPGDPERFLLPCSVSIPTRIFGKINTTVRVTDSNGTPINSTIRPNQSLQFNITVFDDHLTPLEGIIVQLLDKYNQHISEGTTFQNGCLLLSYQTGSTLNSEMELKIRTSNLDYLNGSESIFYFQIGNYSTLFFGLPLFFNLKENTMIEGELHDRPGTAISNASICLFANSVYRISETLTDQNGKFIFDLSLHRDELKKAHFILLQFDGKIGYEPSTAIVGIVPDTTITPLIQFVDRVLPVSLTTFLYPIGIIVLGGFTLISAIFSLKFKRTTRRIVSH